MTIHDLVLTQNLTKTIEPQFWIRQLTAPQKVTAPISS